MKKIVFAAIFAQMLAWLAYGELMMTPWGEKVAAENAWREYPRPQMVRSNWTCLNGYWDYALRCGGRY